MSEVDELWRRSGDGDRVAFGDWMGRVERPVRLALSRFARHVEAEVIVQETGLRMWLRSQDREAPPLEGENASLRFAIGVAWNLARNEARKRSRLDYRDPGELPDVPVEAAPGPDPALRRAIEACIAKLARAPLAALRARIDRSHRMADRELALTVGMTPNTFVQSLVRARRTVERCLADHGIALAEVWR